MFKQHTPEGWKQVCAFYPVQMHTDRYGNETLRYADTPAHTMRVCWHMKGSKSEQADYGRRTEEQREAVFFYENGGLPEIKEEDRFMIDGAFYQVTAAVRSISFLHVTVERVR